MTTARPGAMTLANKITLVRLVLIPVIVIGLLMGAPLWPTLLFILSALTDVLDGLVARRLGQKTVLGSYLDPLADKLFLVFVYFTLAYLGKTPVWVFVVIFARDLLIFLGWNIIYILTQNSTPAPRWLGKASTLLQMSTVVVLLAEPLAPLRPYFVGAMIAVTVASMIDYVWVGAKRLSEIG